MNKKFRNPERIPSTQTKEKDNTEEKAIARKQNLKNTYIGIEIDAVFSHPLRGDTSAG